MKYYIATFDKKRSRVHNYVKRFDDNFYSCDRESSQYIFDEAVYESLVINTLRSSEQKELFPLVIRKHK